MKSAPCPRCGKEVIKPVEKKGALWPFCSARCQDADLHSWLSEEYKIERSLTIEEFTTVQPLNPYDPNAF